MGQWFLRQMDSYSFILNFLVFFCLCLCLTPCICHFICLSYLYYDFHEFPKVATLPDTEPIAWDIKMHQGWQGRHSASGGGHFRQISSWPETLLLTYFDKFRSFWISFVKNWRHFMYVVITCMQQDSHRFLRRLTSSSRRSTSGFLVWFCLVFSTAGRTVFTSSHSWSIRCCKKTENNTGYK